MSPERPYPYSLPAGLLLPMIVLSAMPVVKAGDTQAVEILQLCWLFVSILLFAHDGFRVYWTSMWVNYGRHYAAFLAGCGSLALFSLHLTFYAPPDLPLLKHPLLISVSRIAELFLAIYFLVTTADTLRRDTRLRSWALNAYWITGGVGAFLSCISALLFEVTGRETYFVYNPQHLRARGFFNEAGPYGLYLVSVILVLLIAGRMQPRLFAGLRRIAWPLVIAALLFTKSKAAYVALIGVATLVGAMAGRARQRLLLVSAVLGIGGFAYLILGEQFLGYVNNFVQVDVAEDLHAEDPSFIMGRLAAMLIVPRMITEHPISGIGIGNYSLMRNDPAYLEGLPNVSEWDLPGLGLVGLAAELGLPLTLFFVWVLLRPLQNARRRNADLSILLAAAFQPMGLLAGVNLNFFYPWLVTALVLSAVP